MRGHRIPSDSLIQAPPTPHALPIANIKKTEHGHKHAEAFHLMLYRSEDGMETEILWNSRDGVTPFIIGNRDDTKSMSHISWQSDQYAPNHKPKLGDRIFVDATPELVRASAQEYVDTYWDNKDQFGMTMKDHPEFQPMGKEGAVEFFIKEWCKPGSPHVLTVTLIAPVPSTEKAKP